MNKGAPIADTSPRGFFADQFENTANYFAHFEGTGPEIWRQTNGNVDAFVSGAGTSPPPPKKALNLAKTPNKFMQELEEL